MKKLLTFGALFTAALTIGLGLSVIDAQAGSNPGGCQPTEYYLYCADEINLECIDPWAGDYTLYRCGERVSMGRATASGWTTAVPGLFHNPHTLDLIDPAGRA